MTEEQIEKNTPKPVVLVVLDGWGITKPYNGNAITLAKTPVIDDLIKRYPATVLEASGEAVGLPAGIFGNSEVGHTTMGMGRALYQDLVKINKALEDGSFYKNKVLLKAVAHVKDNNSQLHLIGLVSNGCIHSSVEHLKGLIVLAKRKAVQKIFVHVILDGRDTVFNSGLNFIKELEDFMVKTGAGQIATISGRFYAMDRDNHWDRTSKAYLAMVAGIGNKAATAQAAIEASYEKKIYDEEFVPVVLDGISVGNGLIGTGDAVIFFNYRPDRARQLTKAFVLPSMDKFERPEYLEDLSFITFTKYEDDLPVKIAFTKDEPHHSVGEIMATAGLKQLRIAETEKYAHVTYFFNGGHEERLVGEDDVLISSPRVESYATTPEMSAMEITERVVSEIGKDIYDFILINFANADMVGHTGDLNAAIKAVEAIDKCLGKIAKTVLAKGGCMLVTADHGNVEHMIDPQTETIDKEHTTNPVPLILVGEQFEGRNLGYLDAPGGDLSLVAPHGTLADVGPTILKIMNLERGEEMTGKELI